MNRQGLLIRISLYLVLYFGLSYYAGDLGRKLLYPVRLLVTFLHEFGHGLMAILTGGQVDSIQINADGSGWTRTINGNRALILLGGYLGSALFGNLIFYVGARLRYLVRPGLFLLAGIMLFTGIYWFNSIFTSLVLLLFAASMIFIATKTAYGREFLMFIGLISILFIIQDFNVGPRSDLEAYAQEMIFLPVVAWKYIWLLIVVLLFLFNIRLLYRNSN